MADDVGGWPLFKGMSCADTEHPKKHFDSQGSELVSKAISACDVNWEQALLLLEEAVRPAKSFTLEGNFKYAHTLQFTWNLKGTRSL